MKPFKSISEVKPRRSVFDLSYRKLFDANMGLLYPVMCDEVVPGDHWTIGNQIVARVMPLISPMLHEISIIVHYFFVPYRILWSLWESFITGGKNGDDASVLPRDPCTLLGVKGSLWDYLGYPLVDMSDVGIVDTRPLDFPRRAYSAIWDAYYRDQTLQTELGTSYSNTLLRRCWAKDYFTSALPWAQRGTAPSLPISGLAPVTGDCSIDSGEAPVVFNFAELAAGNVCDHNTFFSLFGTSPVEVGLGSGAVANANAQWNDGQSEPVAHADGASGSLNGTISGDADLSAAVTFNINDVRLAWQIQKWMERNARAGVRYTEFLRAHFGVSPRDDRLQRPEYIGGCKLPVIVSEVLQTSETTVNSPQGNLAGHGLSVGSTYCGKYYAQEFGLIMGLMSIVPIPVYHQGINRQWLRRTRYDYYMPEFATLGEQAIEENELYTRPDDNNNKIVFGFQGRYDELRYKPNMVCGELRPGETFEHWTLARDFGAAVELNGNFLACDPDPRAWAVQSNAPQFVVHFGNSLKVVRPIPSMGSPGLVDHH